MPPLPVQPNIIRVYLHWQEAGADFGSRFFLLYSGGPPSPADMATLATGVRVAYGTDMASFLAAGVNLVEVVCQDLSSQSGAVGVDSIAANGTRTGNALALSTAAVVEYTISRHYRGGKPRTFTPHGVSQDLATSRTWSSAFLTAHTAAWGTFISNVLATSGLTIGLTGHVNVRYYQGYNTAIPPWRGPGFKYPPKLIDPAVAPDNITGRVTRTQVGSQRRRTN